ncbi:proactivator polypeptide-like 1 [Pipistrellus kuhlii]|uniref:Prosaposin like 1 n=1 Tax=Pipistrellus kuhlii TaxID=59472 RepID=A0A7J7QTY7_PIPKU|nr:proactivator polypeptide-like 1 [Pipistrellus kuhlii]KAF6267195.1 prosaposin like 1 [Pipistrellus kuhlii]
MLPALLLLPGLLGAALAGPVQGSPECTRGSAAWCRDLQAAARCGALGHCRSAVWSKPSARTLPCDVCLDVVAAAGNGANPNTTDAEVLALVTKTCEWLPVQDASARCKEMVDAHGPAVLSMLGGPPGSAPPQVCTALTLCRPLQSLPAATPGPLSEEDTSELAAPFMANGPLSFHLPPIPEDPVCRDCVGLVARLQEAVGSNVSALADAVTREQCRSLGPGLALVCRDYMQRFLGPGDHMLRLVLPEETCERGGFCEALPGPAEPAAPALGPLSAGRGPEAQMQAGLTCDVCLQVIHELDRWLDSNSTEALISQALERVCGVMPASIAQQCVTMVDAYSPSLVEFVTRVPPEKVCRAVRLCGGEGGGRRRRRHARPLLGPRATLLPPLLDRDNQGSFCNGCKRLLGVSSRNLERKSTRRGILQAFKGGCRILPLPYMIQCNRFVDEYEPVLFSTLSEVMDPALLCAKVGACHAPRAPLLGTDQCVLGPSFWCASPEAAQMCDALEHCQRFMWKMRPFNSGEPECPPRAAPAP